MKTKLVKGRTYYSLDGEAWHSSEDTARKAQEPHHEALPPPTEDQVKAAAAVLGRKGGKAGGQRKARSRKHYRDMAKKRWGL